MIFASTSLFVTASVLIAAGDGPRGGAGAPGGGIQIPPTIKIKIANEMNLQSLEGQGQGRQEYPDSNVRSEPQPQPREDAQTNRPAPSTVVVFRDQHRQGIQNYAISGTTLWAFAPQRTQRISLADLDIPATPRPTATAGWISVCRAIKPSSVWGEHLGRPCRFSADIPGRFYLCRLGPQATAPSCGRSLTRAC